MAVPDAHQLWSSTAGSMAVPHPTAVSDRHMFGASMRPSAPEEEEEDEEETYEEGQEEEYKGETEEGKVEREKKEEK